MDATKLTAIASLLFALSVAAERLVEIIKGLFPWLNIENSDSTKEGWRRCALQVLAVVAGILTAFFAKNAIPTDLGLNAQTPGGYISLGLLASGGSSFWNSILTYLAKVKDIKTVEAETKKASAPAAAQRPGNP